MVDLPGYLKDTKQLLTKFNHFQWQECYRWISCDVASLYSSIPHHLGIRAVATFLRESGRFSLVLQEFILLSLEYLLTHNFFMFDGGYYLQRCGASMGAKFSPSLANLFMGWWERSRIFGHDSPRRLDTVFYCRYIDDLLFVTSDSNADLLVWLAFLNDNPLNLKFTGELNMNTINFLDVNLTGVGDKVVSSIHRKSTAGNALLRADSAHPKHTIRGVPYGQFLRLRRLCSVPETFDREAHNMALRFKDRGYPEHIITKALSAACSIPRTDLLQGSRKSAPTSFDNTPVFSTPFSLEFQKIKNIVAKYLPILYNDPAYNTILSRGFKAVSRRAPTLGRSLSPSLFTSKTIHHNWLSFKGTFKCGIKSCIYCGFIKTGPNVTSCSNGREFEIKSFINCNTKHTVYVISCTACNIQYVGRTIRRLRDRLRDHLYDISTNKKTNAARHWNTEHFQDTSSLVIQGMENVKTPIRGGNKFRALCKREVFWIFSLQTRIPSGLNFEWDVSHYYD